MKVNNIIDNNKKIDMQSNVASDKIPSTFADFEKQTANAKSIKQKLASRQLAKQQKIDKRNIQQPLLDVNSLEYKLFELAKHQPIPNAKWYKLDNAAVIFPAASNAGFGQTFRISAILKEAVDPIVMQQALNDVVPRFPTICAELRRGLFWYYLDAQTKPLVLQQIKDYTCMAIPYNEAHSLIRVTYFDCQIGVDVFHSATDGTGGVMFLNSLLAQYFKLLGRHITMTGSVLHAGDVPRAAERQDMFVKLANKRSKAVNHNPTNAYKSIGAPINDQRAVVHSKAIFSGKQLGDIAKKHNANISQLLVASLLLACQREKNNKGDTSKKSITTLVPVNLRRFFPSETLRNFSSVIGVISNGDETFEQLLQLTKNTFESCLTKEYLLESLNYNVNIQTNLFIKYIPLFIKDIVLALGFKMVSNNGNTANISNLGVISTPPEFKDYVYRYDFVFSQMNKRDFMNSCISFNDVTTLCTTHSRLETDLEQEFYRILSNLGLELVVETDVKLKQLLEWQDKN